jgi:membrane protein YdbS with pleckstrin-like domain
MLRNIRGVQNRRTKTKTKNQNQKNKKMTTNSELKTSITGAFLLLLAVILIFIGFALDGITEYGHHAMLIISGMCIGIGIGKLKD